MKNDKEKVKGTWRELILYLTENTPAEELDSRLCPHCVLVACHKIGALEHPLQKKIDEATNKFEQMFKSVMDHHN